ncbi:DKNYY domain-containing protein [uncultured Duncaniella sp.]|uniref:DKNYY domain-containing protein n=1 Tax=uncultured Duncaniella sp. TaxID=2768039 RepID=UPI00272C1D46|nr:DKNYY domain-containing protein [uncultured Duncaniella sp.]
MKKILFILAMAISLSAISLSAEERGCRQRGGRLVFEHQGRHHRPAYFIGENNVYFEGRKIQDASASSFAILHDGYAKDTWNTYYWGRKID